MALQVQVQLSILNTGRGQGWEESSFCRRVQKWLPIPLALSRK